MKIKNMTKIANIFIIILTLKMRKCSFVCVLNKMTFTIMCKHNYCDVNEKS
jgi:hypothetical protein